MEPVIQIKKSPAGVNTGRAFLWQQQGRYSLLPKVETGKDS